KRWIFIALWMSACGTDQMKLPDVDAGDSGAHDAVVDDGATDGSLDASDDADLDSSVECACDEVGPCCDGCDVIGLDESCASECAATASGQADGTCAGEADACDHLVTEPQCQAVTCDEEFGCGAVQNIREGHTCDDGDAQTYDDRCAGGSCVGTACECS